LCKGKADEDVEEEEEGLVRGIAGFGMETGRADDVKAERPEREDGPVVREAAPDRASISLFMASILSDPWVPVPVPVPKVLFMASILNDPCGPVWLDAPPTKLAKLISPLTLVEGVGAPDDALLPREPTREPTRPHIFSSSS